MDKKSVAITVVLCLAVLAIFGALPLVANGGEWLSIPTWTPAPHRLPPIATSTAIDIPAPISLPLATDTPVRYVCVIASTALNLRVTPGTQEAPAAVLATGERLVWIAERDGWTQIVYRDEPGYVKSEFVTSCQ